MNWITRGQRRVGRKLMLVCTIIALTVATRRVQAQDQIEVHLVTPPHRPGCAGEEFFWREFQRAMGAENVALEAKTTIDVEIIELDTDEYQLILRGLPQWTKEEHRVYGPPTECSKVVAYAADIAAQAILNTQHQHPQPKSVPPFTYAWGGVRAVHGLTPQILSLGPVIGVGTVLSPDWSAEFALAMTMPYTWRTRSGQPVDVQFGGAASLALCYQWPRLTLCPKATLGGYDGRAEFLDRPSYATSTYYLTAGLETVKLISLSPTTKLRLGANTAVTSIIPAFQIGPAIVWRALPITVTWEVALMTW